MLGFRPMEDHLRVSALPHDLQMMNELLRPYTELYDMFDAWIVLSVANAEDQVLHWRLEAEHKMIAECGSGMTDEQVRDFVERFLPAYRLYLPTLYSEGPCGPRKEHIPVLQVINKC